MSNLPSEKMLAVYWIPSVGIGKGTPPPPVLDGSQTVEVPLTDVLNYKLKDGSPMINVVNLTGATFNTPDKFGHPYLNFSPALKKVLVDGTVARLQAEGIKVLLTIMGADHKTVGWSTIPDNQIEGFVNYLNNAILSDRSNHGHGLDGIDVDDEYALEEPEDGGNIADTLKKMRQLFPPHKLISKALFHDLQFIDKIAQYLDYGGIMEYGDDAGYLKYVFGQYVGKGFKPQKMLIGVNAGPVKQPGTSFTSLETTRTLTRWQPGHVKKLGMMLWTFSQDIQQFTAYPQNQVALKYPNPDDHAWQKTISEIMHGPDA